MEKEIQEKFVEEIESGTLLRNIDHSENGNGFISYLLLKEVKVGDSYRIPTRLVGELMTFRLTGFEVSSFKYVQVFTDDIWEDYLSVKKLGYEILETNKEKALKLFVSMKEKYLATRYDEDFVVYENEKLFKRCAEQLERGIL